MNVEENDRQLINEKMAKLREAAAEKRIKEKKELDAALLGKSKEEQQIYRLRKRIAKLKQAQKEIIAQEEAHKKKIFVALGTAIVGYHKVMEKPDEVIRQLQIVADSLDDKSKKTRALKLTSITVSR